MSDEDALLAAIAAHPDEDTPRLVFADWLDEHDRHIRAEFIRVQIEIEQKWATLSRRQLDQHVDLFKRQQELIDNHRAELLGPLATLPKETPIEFRRGFVSELILPAHGFANHSRLLATVAPLPRVVVADHVANVRHFLGFLVHVDSVPETHLVSAIRTVPDVDDEDVYFHASVEQGRVDLYPYTWPRLNELDISGCHLGVDNALSLLRIETFPALFDLDLSGNDFTDSVIMPFMRSGLPRQIKRLILGGNPLSDFGVRLLAELWPTGADDRLVNLNLRFTNIGLSGQQALLARFGGRLELF